MSDALVPKQLQLPEDDERLEVEASVLIWARDSIGLKPERAAKKIGVSPATLAKWESGETTPTLPQLRKAAAAYKRSLAVLLLPRPAKDFDALRDFRSGTMGMAIAPSPELTAEYWRALTQREVLLELSDLGALPEGAQAAAATISLDTPPEQAGSCERSASGWALIGPPGRGRASRCLGGSTRPTSGISLSSRLIGFRPTRWPVSQSPSGRVQSSA